MAGPLRYAPLRRLQVVVLGLALLGLVITPTASRAAQLDTVRAVGDAGGPVGIGNFEYSQISIHASSGPSGQNATGSASFGYDNATGVVGPITCLSVTGLDQGGGTDSGSPTTAVLNVNDSVSSSIVTVQIVDNGGNGDTFSTSLSNGPSAVPRAPDDCSPFTASLPDPATMMNGRTVVFDASTSTSTTTAGFTTSPASSTVGTQVTFDAASSTCAAAPCTYAWTDGAHKLGSGTPLTFTFHYVGIKHVLLTVTDALGGTASVQHDLWVSQRRCFTADPPIARIAKAKPLADRCFQPTPRRLIRGGG